MGYHSSTDKKRNSSIHPSAAASCNPLKRVTGLLQRLPLLEVELPQPFAPIVPLIRRSKHPPPTTSLALCQSLAHDPLRRLLARHTHIPFMHSPSRSSGRIHNVWIVGHAIDHLRLSPLLLCRSASHGRCRGGLDALHRAGTTHTTTTLLLHISLRSIPLGDRRACQTALSSSSRRAPTNARNRSADSTTSAFTEADKTRIPFIAETGTARDTIVQVLAHLIRVVHIATARPSGAATYTTRGTGATDGAAFFLLELHVVEVSRWLASSYAGGEVGWSTALADGSYAFETREAGDSVGAFGIEGVCGGVGGGGWVVGVTVWEGVALMAIFDGCGGQG